MRHITLIPLTPETRLKFGGFIELIQFWMI